MNFVVLFDFDILGILCLQCLFMFFGKSLIISKLRLLIRKSLIEVYKSCIIYDKLSIFCHTDPTIQTSLRWLTQDYKNPMNKFVFFIHWKLILINLFFDIPPTFYYFYVIILILKK